MILVLLLFCCEMRITVGQPNAELPDHFRHSGQPWKKGTYVPFPAQDTCWVFLYVCWLFCRSDERASMSGCMTQHGGRDPLQLPSPDLPPLEWV